LIPYVEDYINKLRELRTKNKDKDKIKQNGFFHNPHDPDSESEVPI